MSSRLAHLALALYPRSYRRRYGEEMAALVEDAGAGPKEVVDLMRGALTAHLRPSPAVAAELDVGERLRVGMGSVLLCWVLFAGAGLALYKTIEGPSFAVAAADHRLLGGAHIAIAVIAALATALVLLGAAPLVLAALRQGRERRAVRRATATATGYVLAFVVISAALDAIVHPLGEISGGLAFGILAAWAVLGLGCGIGCVRACRRGLDAIELPAATLRLSMLAADGVAIAMTAIATATAVYLGALLVLVPGLAAEGNGPLGLASVAASLAIQLAVMVAVALLGAVSAVRAQTRARSA